MKTITYIENMRRNLVRVSKEQEKAIIDYFGKNISKEFTEQDICEQVNHIMNNY